MIRPLTHAEIDKAKWDLCIGQSVNSLIYGYSWYLDIVAPDWEGLVLNDYEAVFPLTHRKKIFRYLYQPYFTQQLGLFYRNEHVSKRLTEFLEAIPEKFGYIDIQLNEGNEPDEKRWQVKKRKNFILDLNKPHPKLVKNFSEPTRRNIKKSHKHELTIQSIEPTTGVDFYRTHKGIATIGVNKKDYGRFESLLQEVHNHQMLICQGVFTREGELVATAIIYSTQNRLYLINNCTSPKGKELRAMYLLLDHLILQYANQPICIDFEGSDIPGIAQFNKGFGAEKHPYFHLRINRLPWYIKLFKN